MNVVDFWDKRAEIYEPVPAGKLEDGLLSVMGDYREPNDTILEAGSGTGRIYHLVMGIAPRNPDLYQMCDISPVMAKRCQARTGQPVTVWDGWRLPYAGGSMDWVISYSVLLHVPPEAVAWVIQEHARVARKYLFVSTFAGPYEGELSPHCFLHDYEAIFKRLGLPSLFYRYYPQEQQAQWLLMKG